MKVLLKDLATVQMGYTFRSRLDASKTGNVGVIQMKDLTDDNAVACSGLTKITMDKIKTHHLAQKGDLVFRSRGQVNNAALLLDDPGNAVIAAPLLRIRIKNTAKILPEYLNWYLSQHDAQAYFASRAEGTTQKMINILALEELEIFLPNLQQQKAIVELASLVAYERGMLYAIAEKRSQYISSILMQCAKGEKW